MDNFEEPPKLLSDDELFQDPPPKEDCPICMLPMPYSTNEVCGVMSLLQPCCGKRICLGCVIATGDEIEKKTIKEWCPFCRKPGCQSFPIPAAEYLKRLMKRQAINDAEAIYRLGRMYHGGVLGTSR